MPLRLTSKLSTTKGFGTKAQRTGFGQSSVFFKESDMRYIQRRGNGYLETVDEFTTHREAREMLKEYRLSDPSAYFYISQRSCADWRKSC